METNNKFSELFTNNSSISSSVQGMEQGYTQSSVPSSIQILTQESVPCSDTPLGPEETQIITSSSEFEVKLWGQYENLHKRHTKKIEYYENYYRKFEPIHNCLSESLKIFKNTIMYSQEQSQGRPSFLYSRTSITDDELKNFYKDAPNTINYIKKAIGLSIEQANQTVSIILIIFSNFIKEMKEEKKKYDDLQKQLSSYMSGAPDRLKIIEKNMKIYHQQGEATEKAVLNFKKVEQEQESISESEFQDIIDKAKKSLDDYIKPFNTYKESVKKENVLRNKYINKHKQILRLYYDYENKADILNEEMIQIFYQHTQNQLELDKENSKDFEFLKKDFKKGENIDILIREFGEKEKPEEELKIEPFHSIIDFDMCDNSKTFKTYFQTILFIKNCNKEEYPNFNMEEENEKNDMRETINKLFENYSEENETKLMKYIDNPSKYNSFFKILGKFRNNKVLNNDKKLYNILGNILNIILDMSYLKEQYEDAINCIIFSKIFYYYSEDNIKHYLIEKIENHKWLTSFDFWRNLILTNLKQELNKFLSFYSDITMEDIEEINRKITDKIKSKLSELLLSQILPYMNFMSDFNISKEIIINLIEELCSKYKYLDGEKIEGMLNLAIKDKQKLRKVKEKMKNIIDESNITSDMGFDTKIVKNQKKKKTHINIRYDHLNKDEKNIENPL